MHLKIKIASKSKRTGKQGKSEKKKKPIAGIFFLTWFTKFPWLVKLFPGENYH